MSLHSISADEGFFATILKKKSTEKYSVISLSTWLRHLRQQLEPLVLFGLILLCH